MIGLNRHASSSSESGCSFCPASVVVYNMEVTSEEVRRRAGKKFVDELYKNFYPNDRDATRTAEALERMEREEKKQSAFSVGNICWFISAIALFYFLDFPTACLYDPRVHRTWFNVGALLIAVNLCIAAFLIVWLSAIKKVSSDDWETQYPAAIPIATATFIFGSFCVMVGLWPLWGWLTPLILFTLFMGLIVVIISLPSF